MFEFHGMFASQSGLEVDQVYYEDTRATGGGIMTSQERQPWQDPWQNLNFLRGKLTPRWQEEKPENRAIDPVFSEADKIAARGMGVQL
jgi:hypothetical protein